MKKALLVSYGFPPVGGAGVQRPVKFVKYLRKFGWEPLVLTVANPSVPVQDSAMLNDIPEGVKVCRASSLEPSYAAKQGFSGKGKQGSSWLKTVIKKTLSLFLLPDMQILWWPGMAKKLISVIRAEKPDCLYVTAPPFSSFIPVVVAGKLFRVPVVLDYRDEWAFSRASWENASKSGLAFFLDTVLERFALANCSAFTVATGSYLNSLANRYGAQLLSKGTVITNGYDSDDFVGATSPKQLEQSDVTIVYTGTVWNATSLSFFCSALGKLLCAKPELKKIIRLKIFGRVVAEEMPYILDESVKDVIESFGYIEHDRIAGEMLNADILLLTLSDMPGAEKIIHGKVFEYMASGRHILALIPDGEVKTLLSEHYDNMTIIHPNDSEQTDTALQNICRSIDTIRASHGKDVSCFEREKLTEKLARLFDRIVL